MWVPRGATSFCHRTVNVVTKEIFLLPCFRRLFSFHLILPFSLFHLLSFLLFLPSLHFSSLPFHLSLHHLSFPLLSPLSCPLLLSFLRPVLFSPLLSPLVFPRFCRLLLHLVLHLLFFLCRIFHLLFPQIYLPPLRKQTLKSSNSWDRGQLSSTNYVCLTTRVNEND